MDTIAEHVFDWIEKFNHELSRSFPDILRRFPLDKCIMDFKSYDVVDFGGRFISNKLKRNFIRIKHQYGDNAIELYLKLLLAAFISSTLESEQFSSLPEPIKELSRQWYEMVCSDFSNQPGSYYDHEKFAYCLALALCSLKALPIGGSWYIEEKRCRKSSLLKSYYSNEERSPGNLPRRRKINVALKTLLVKLHLYERLVSILDNAQPLQSYYFIHTIDRFLPRFSEENMAIAYMNIAELLEQNPQVAGIYRRSWFLDPALKEMTPALSYLWEVPTRNGANLFRIGPCDKVLIQKAIGMSPVRKKLYKSGKYIPTIYAYIWTRKDVIHWAQEQTYAKSIHPEEPK